jgi:hypothetical protein
MSIALASSLSTIATRHTVRHAGIGSVDHVAEVPVE